MFAGIIQTTSPVLSTAKRGSCIAVRIKHPKWRLAVGQSISVDGICSTVTKRTSNFFEVEYMPETLSKTTASSFTRGILVNLERSLTLASFVDGHLVMGHVDARARVAGVREDGNSRVVSIAIPASLIQFVASQGSAAINGVSLTIARMAGGVAEVALIPHTLSHTNLGHLKRGDFVNVEVDSVARYVVAALATPKSRPRRRRRG